ncbi:MAG TPA: hypothetical protein VK095_08765 [Beutenbergiaceae bacterium]|nr:hypothetical protein [Beutenbergiaceae bacterium]
MAMTRAQYTYFTAMERNGNSRFTVNDLILPERILDPDETVYDVAMGGLSSDTFPLLIVTDLRVIHTKDQPWRRWRILREAPLPYVLGADVKARLLWGRLRVRIHGGKDIKMGLRDRERPEEVAALIRRLVGAGALPP